MDTKHIISVALAIAVAAVVFSMVMVPTIGSATDTEDTFTNEGLWRMKEIENGDSWTRSAEGVWTYNLTDTMSNTSSPSSNVVLGDDWCVRNSGQLRGHTIGGNPATPSLTATESEVTFTLGGGLNGSVHQSLTGYGYSKEGSFVMLPYGEYAYMNGDSPIYATGNTNINGASVIVHITGTIEDSDISITVDSNFSNSGTPVLSDLAITNKSVNYTEVDGYVDLYKLESITFDASFNLTINDTTTPYSGSVTYSSYVVPYEVTAEKSVHADGITISLLNMLPILVAAGLLVAIVGVMFYKFRR